MRPCVEFGDPVTENLGMTGEMKNKQENENVSTEIKNNTESHYCRILKRCSVGIPRGDFPSPHRQTERNIINEKRK
jgi:hypothetical protein